MAELIERVETLEKRMDELEGKFSKLFTKIEEMEEGLHNKMDKINGFAERFFGLIEKIDFIAKWDKALKDIHRIDRLYLTLEGRINNLALDFYRSSNNSVDNKFVSLEDRLKEFEDSDS